MIALIDGDILVYRVGFASENQTEAQNCMNTELVMEQILADTGATEYKVFLSDKLENNFRYQIDPEYKANRKEARKPRWYDSIRMFLVNEFNAEYTPGQEADDALGIEQCANNAWEHGMDGPDRAGESVICSIDKDLLQIPGNHYDITKRTKQTVSYIDGIRHFYAQLLIGDRVDNIEGIYGLGPIKSAAILKGCDNELDMFERVRTLYGDDGRLLKNGQLLWIRRQEGEVWKFPVGEVGEGEGRGSRELVDDTEEDWDEPGEPDAETK